MYITYKKKSRTATVKSNKKIVGLPLDAKRLIFDYDFNKPINEGFY